MVGGREDAPDVSDILLGQIQVIPVADKKNVINMFAQQYYGYDGKRYTSYDAFWSCLGKIREQVPKGSKIAFPYKIGCDRGGANWNVILSMIAEILGTDYKITICYFPPFLLHIPKNRGKNKNGDLMIITNNGVIIRLDIENVSVMSRVTKGVKLMIFGCVFFVVFALLVQVFCGATTGNLSLTVEKLKYEIDNQEKKNESLKMQVSELTSYDKIKDVVKDMGLAYNNENIIIISK
jgi:cell division protein FtsL